MFRKILYPTDFSASAEEALEYVKKLKEAGTEEVILLHVYDERDVDVQWEVEAQIHPEEPLEKSRHDVLKRMLENGFDRLKELEKEITHFSFKTELIVEVGIPYQKIIQAADNLHVSLIVMGSHGEHGFVEKLFGSTTGRVLAHGNVPVLVVKPKNHPNSSTH